MAMVTQWGLVKMAWKIGSERAEIEVELLGSNGMERDDKALTNKEDCLELEEQDGNPDDSLGSYQLARDRTRKAHKAPI